MKILLVVCLVNLTVISVCVNVDEVPCTSSSDCSPLHICYNGPTTAGLIGKRNFNEIPTGICTLLKTEGQSCWVNGATITTRPDHVVRNNLPCELGLYCKGIGVFLANFGEAGNCEPVGQ